MNVNLLKLSTLVNLSKCSKLLPSLVNLSACHKYSVQTDLSPNKSVTDTFDFIFDDDILRCTKVGTSSYWRRKMRTVHSLLDVNKDGIVSYDDFKLLADRFVRLGNLPHDRRIEFYEIIERMWKEQWGCNHPYNLVTTEQYLEDMEHVVNDEDRRKRVHRLLPYLFMAVDHNHDSSISFSEYQLFFKCLGLSYQDAIVSFESIDLDKNGVLTMEEFVKLGREYFVSDDENEASKLFWGPLTT